MIGKNKFGPFAPTNNIVVDGRGGADRIVANNSIFDFTVFGGAGNDYVVTGEGNDFIDGGDGLDRINAGDGDNDVIGGAGNDSLNAGRGNDILDGNAGNDRLTGDGGDDLLIGGDGNDVLLGGKGNDTALGGNGNDNIDGYFGDDVIVGGEGADYLKGGSDQDVIIGSTGADRLFGGVGDDLLIGDAIAGEADLEQLAALFVVWQENSFAGDDRGAAVRDFLNENDDDEDFDRGIVPDNSKDILDGGAGEDLFFITTGQDKAQFVRLGDNVEPSVVVDVV
jgi:Ca2+-binding RTX toxin-like protein